MHRIMTRSPFTGDVVAEVDVATPDEVVEAVDTAARGQQGWSRVGGPSRGMLLSAVLDEVRRRRGELAQLVTAEVGKPIVEAEAEVRRVEQILVYYAGMAHEIGGVTRGGTTPSARVDVQAHPVGVVAAITPWNFPLAVPAWKLVPALAAGCSVVWKPSPLAVGCAEALHAAFLAAGLPKDVLQVVHGGGRTGEALVDAAVDAITFTGSTSVGTGILRTTAARPQPPRLTLELGGVNIAHVLDDADVEAAAGDVATAAFGFAGQKCTATQLAVVDRVVAGPFSEALAEATLALPVGDPRARDTACGPVISPQVATSLRATLAGHQQTHRVVAQHPVTEDGAFVAPTVLELDGPHAALVCEEVFGPVLGIVVVDTLDERMAISRASGLGLAASVHGRDPVAVRRTTQLAATGVVGVNRPSTGLEPHVPFGGWGRSGHGPPEQGRSGLEFFLKTQTVYWHDDAVAPHS